MKDMVFIPDFDQLDAMPSFTELDGNVRVLTFFHSFYLYLHFSGSYTRKQDSGMTQNDIIFRVIKKLSLDLVGKNLQNIMSF